mgnify:CR=1 FL=1
MCTYQMRNEGCWTLSQRSVYWSATDMNKRVISAITLDQTSSSETRCHLRQVRVMVFAFYSGSNSNMSSEDEVSEAKMPPDECEIRSLEESPILFRLSGPNERLSRHDQSDVEMTSSVDSAVQSPRRKPRRRLTRKEKGKKKMVEYDMERDESDRHESDSEKNEDGPSESKAASAKKASKSANAQSRRSTHQKNHVLCFG